MNPNPTIDPSEPVAFDRSIAEFITLAGEAVQQHVGAARLTGTITGHKPGRYTTFAQLVAHKPDGNEIKDRLRTVIPAGVITPGTNLNGSLVAITGQGTAHNLYGPLQFTAQRIEVIDAESEATRAVAEMRHTIIAKGLDQANKALPLPEQADRIAIICPIGGGAGGADVLEQLTTGTYDWNLEAFGVSMGANDSANRIAIAIEKHSRNNYQAILVCRGGGAASDMAAFNSRQVAKAIIEAPTPIIVAVGHATDEHIADLVAHTSVPTPTAAADWLNQRRGAATRQARELIARAEHAQTIAAQAQAAADQHQAEAAASSAKQRERQATVVLAVALAAIIAAIAVLVVLSILR